ncbi:uncharacterized protein [Acropora muricata]|uniref:uncharacterized protein n=1 Tax=Acropora muricata TaxID=159855 RepID=UPI0034E4B236
MATWYTTEYFLIVSQENELVLDISTGTIGGDLVLSEARGKSSQLWRWDQEGRLVSKLGWVADMKGTNKEAGTVCHAWEASDDVNQKWHFKDNAIKSDVNDLVIDARTLPVSMCEVDGSLTQKWNFIPENLWADGRPVALSVKYFFIASQKNGLVLDISEGTKGVNLVLTEAHGKPSQLWRWDEDCRLVSKLGWVADIKEKKKKAGSVCYAWDAHDGLNQKWRVEEGAIKNSLNGLVIDATELSVTIQVAKEHTPSQKWYFIPENVWDDFKLVQSNPNPLNQAQFWKNLADNYLDVIIGYSIDDYEEKLRRAFEILDECSSKLDKVAKDTGIAKTVGGSAAIVGGGMAVAGLALSPITAGASLGLTIAGAATGVAGGVTSTSSSLVRLYGDKSEAKKIKKATAPLFHATLSLHGFLTEYINILEEAKEFLKKPEVEGVAKDAYTAEEVILAAGGVASKVYKIGEVVYTGIKYAKNATQLAAPGIKMPGKTIVAAGTTTAIALSGSLACIAIVFGIWDVATGAQKIKKGSQLAQEFRKSSESLKKESAKLIALYKELQ